MEIYSDCIKLNSYDFNIEKINSFDDASIIGLTSEYNILFMYKINGSIYYSTYNPYKRYLNFIFFEIINKSPLWKLELKKIYDNNFNTATLKFIIYLSDTKLVPDFINISLGLNTLIIEKFTTKVLTFSKEDFTHKSYIPYIENVSVDNNFKLKLYDYQEKSLSKMIAMENNQINIINYSLNINFIDNDILYDPIRNIKINEDVKFNIKTKGGILSDEMGLGKTITSIALIYKNPSNYTNNFFKSYLYSKATVIICPSHLVKQWESEIKKCYNNFKILTILTKLKYNNLTFKDFIEADIIITSHQFIMNVKFYPTLYYKPFHLSNYNYKDRLNELNKKIINIIKKPYEEILLTKDPIFEFFHFHRLILDEGHEIFAEELGTSGLSRYMGNWLLNIESSYKWYVSGTPFLNICGIRNCAKFINLELVDEINNININFKDHNYRDYGTRYLNDFLDKEYLWKNILEKICIRHKKSDVENQIQIPGYSEKLIWVKFTNMEKQLYDSKKDKVSCSYLQQLCCHPLIIDSSRKYFGQEIDLSIMQDKLIEYHTKNLELYKDKLIKLDTKNQAYYMLKKTFENQISESTYMLTIFNKLNNQNINEEDNCAICLDNITNPTLTACGHLYCYECIKECLDKYKICPTCRSNLVGKDLLVMNKKSNNDNLNPLIDKYGSKLGKLISIIRVLTTNDDTRIIIFSQWDDMLTLIGRSLAENGIENSFVKGNVWCRNSAIKKFKQGKNDNGNDNKVIMLSLKNAASGTNLTEATHIFFVEPIDGTPEKCKAIEGQAIARACRVGQKNKIILTRILVENSIEETIYRKSYNNNIIITNNEIEV